ncbi:MAG: tetratricopeptide repeat protein, partial [Acidobacteriota bacterium]|nr:tetratricopeptide repeat protein [Acidobacteriota bacterium]
MQIRLNLEWGYRFAIRGVAIALLLMVMLSLQTPVAKAFAAPDLATEQSNKKLLKLARKQLRKGLFGESERTIKRVLATDPGNHTAKVDIAYVYFKQRRLLDSYEHALKVAQEDPENSYAFAILGSLYLATGDFAEARLFLTNAIALNKREALAWASLGMLEFHQNRVRESILNLQEAVFYNRLEPDFEYALAQVSSRGERYKEAAKAYERFLRIAPDNDTERRDRIRGLIRFLSFLGNRSGIYQLAGESTTIVETRIVNNRPVVPVRFQKNGEVLDFVLDTGSGITVISEETAKKFKVRPVARGGVARALGGSGKFKIVYGFLDSIRIGEVTVRNV